MTLIAALGPADRADAAELRPVAELRVSVVGTGSIDLRWRDRSRGESAYEIQTRAGGGLEIEAGEAGATGATVREAGARHRLRGPGPRLQAQAAARRGAGASARRRCWRPINGPHPDPGCPTFPAGDEFNRDVSTADVAPNSDEIIARINADGGDFAPPRLRLQPQVRDPLRRRAGAPSPAVPIHFGPYGDESDRGPYPVPPGAPVEGGSGSTGDRHVLVVRRPPSPAAPVICSSSTAPSSGATATTAGAPTRGPASTSAPRSPVSAPTAGPRRTRPACRSTPASSPTRRSDPG